MSTLKVNAIQNSSGTGGVDIQATNTNDAAAAGDVGEIKRATTLRTSAVALTTTGAARTIATLSNVDPGDWLASAHIGYDVAVSTTTQFIQGAISKTAATFPAGAVLGVPTAGEAYFENAVGTVVPDFDLFMGIPGYRVSLSATTTFYLVAGAGFTSSTISAYGSIEFWRPR